MATQRLRQRLAWLRFCYWRCKAKPFPTDRHILPRMRGNYIEFPNWTWRGDVTAWLCIQLGERCFGGRYCFTVDRNRMSPDELDHLEMIERDFNSQIIL